MIDILSFFMNKYFAIFICIWAILGYVILNKIFKSIEKYKNISNDTKNKYKDFVRNDWKHWSFIKLYIGFILFSWIKLTLAVLTVILSYACIRIITFNKDITCIDKKLRNRLTICAKISGLMFSLSCGIFTRIKYINADYTEYLGNNYNTNINNNFNKEEKYASIVSNHISWLDIALLMKETGCGFIASSAVKSFFMVGTVCSWIGSIYVDRTSKDDRNNSLLKLQEKLSNIYNEKDSSNLAIFPEGTTTNGTCILPFKKGAFCQMYPVKPIIIKTDVINRISLAMDIIEMLNHIIIICCVPYYIVELRVLPVFNPDNSYFKSIYIKNIKEKIKSKTNKHIEDWEVYADSVRQCIIKYGNFENGSSGYSDKREFLDRIRSKNKQSI